MINENLILDFFSRIITLEEKVKSLETEVSLLKEIIEENETPLENDYDTTTKITRSVSRKYVMDKIKNFNPILSVDKGTRALGSGIVINSPSCIEITNCKFYHSKSFHEDFPASWHTINEEDLNDTNIHCFIFNLEHQGKYYTFIFSRTELVSFVSDKVKDQNNNYHFYFHIKHGKVLECRDRDKDVSTFLNRWSVFK